MDESNDGHLEVKYIPFHTGHKLGPAEIKHLPLPESTKELQSPSVGVERQVRLHNQQPQITEPVEKALQVR